MFRRTMFTHCNFASDTELHEIETRFLSRFPGITFSFNHFLWLGHFLTIHPSPSPLPLTSPKSWAEVKCLVSLLLYVRIVLKYFYLRLWSRKEDKDKTTAIQCRDTIYTLFFISRKENGLYVQYYKMFDELQKNILRTKHTFRVWPGEPPPAYTKTSSRHRVVENRAYLYNCKCEKSTPIAIVLSAQTRTGTPKKGAASDLWNFSNFWPWKLTFGTLFTKKNLVKQQ